MKIEILQENLTKGLMSVSRFVDSKPSLPVLSCVLFKAEKGKLLVFATNMDSGAVVEIGARVIEEGEVAIPAKIAFEYVSSLPVGKMVIETKGSAVKMVSGNNVANINGQKVDDFPELPKIQNKNSVKIAAKTLGKIVRLVVFSSLSETTRPVLSAVLFKFSKKKTIEVVSTDGYRLSRLSGLPIDNDGAQGEVLIPSKILGEVERLVKDQEAGEILMFIDKEKRSVEFEVGKIKLTSKVVNGDFPDYKKIMPTETETVFKADKESMKEAVKLAAVFARENSNIVRWKLADNKLIMSSNSEGAGEQESIVEGTLEKGEGGMIAFNGRFLIELFGNVHDGGVEFSMNNALQPGLFRSEDTGFTHVIMPVRINSESSD